jgi:hypothetical protein
MVFRVRSLYVRRAIADFSEGDAQMHLIRPRRDEMRAAERRQEVVERVLVGEIDDAEAQADLPLVAVEQVVDAEAQVDQVPWRDAGRVVDIIFRARGGIFSRVAPPPEAQFVMGASRVATVLPQKKPMAACWSPLSASASLTLATEPATRPES